MNQLVAITPAPILPVLIVAADDRTRMRFMEFFAANIRNPRTRKAYARATAEFLAWLSIAVVAVGSAAIHYLKQ